MDKSHQDMLEEIDRKLTAIMRVQDANAARLKRIQDNLETSTS